MTRTRLLLVDSQEIIRVGIRHLISQHCCLEVVGECASKSEALSQVLQLQPDLILMDTQLPDGCGLQACREIQTRAPAVKVIFLAATDDPDMQLEALLAGGDAFLMKNVDARTLLHTIDTVAAGEPVVDPAAIPSLVRRIRARSVPPLPQDALSRQEHRIMELVAAGKTNKQIGQVLGLSDKTIKNYLSHIYQKLNVTRRSEAAVLFMQRLPAAAR